MKNKGIVLYYFNSKKKLNLFILIIIIKMDINRDQLVKCTNCKVPREQHNFIGKSGNIVKRCLKCREKDEKQKKRPDVIEKRNQRQNEKKYYIKCREKKREENEEEYLKHNAEIAKNWRDNNKEHVKY